MPFKKKKTTKKPAKKQARKRAPMPDPDANTEPLETMPTESVVEPEGDDEEAATVTIPEPDDHLQDPEVRDLFQDDEGKYHLVVAVNENGIGTIRRDMYTQFYEIPWGIMLGGMHAIPRDKLPALPWKWIANMEDKWHRA